MYQCNGSGRTSCGCLNSSLSAQPSHTVLGMFFTCLNLSGTVFCCFMSPVHIQHVWASSTTLSAISNQLSQNGSRLINEFCRDKGDIDIQPRRQCKVYLSSFSLWTWPLFAVTVCSWCRPESLSSKHGANNMACCAFNCISRQVCALTHCDEQPTLSFRNIRLISQQLYPYLFQSDLLELLDYYVKVWQLALVDII